MSKKYYWEIPEEKADDETGELTGETVLHTVQLKCSKITGHAMIEIDKRAFDISVKPFSLGGVEQIFKLGDIPALLKFSKKGVPSISVNNTDMPLKQKA